VTTRRAWPFPGDSSIVRARKAALAYRQMAADNEKLRQQLTEVVRRVDPRIVAWIEDDEFKGLYKQIHDDSLDVPSTVDQLDRRLYEWGEDWHAVIKREAYNDDDMINAVEAGEILGVNKNSINRMRNRGRLEGEWIKHDGDQNGRWYYRAGDVYRLSSEVRARASRDAGSTDKVHTDSTGDSK
jgi:hypothetical protein